jgi:uncharacterized membrane protein
LNLFVKVGACAAQCHAASQATDADAVFATQAVQHDPDIGKTAGMIGMLEPNAKTIHALRLGLLWFLAIFYFAAGIFHLVLPEALLSIMPDWVPFPRQAILLTGLCELAGALGLLVPSLRKIAGSGLALYAIAVFPANIRHAILDIGSTHPSFGLWYHIPRFALQPILVWAALFASSTIKWPISEINDSRRL